MDAEQLSKLRFAMSQVPQVGGDLGTYGEKWAQWFLEQSFFRDFVYRNPAKKKGAELADAVVLFDDVALMVQVKAQCGSHIATAWATERILEAIKQLKSTHKAFNAGHPSKLKNDFYGDVKVNAGSYPNQIGLIILAQQAESFIAAQLAPEILTATFPIHVISLNDFQTIAARFDTAADLIIFLELRGDIAAKVPLYVHDEMKNIVQMLPYVRETFKDHTTVTSSTMLDAMYESFAQKATGTLAESPAWKYGLAIDDMIARSHDIDPNLAGNRSRQASSALEVARFLSWLTRDRRIKLGKRLLQKCEAGRDGQPHYFTHRQPSKGTCCVFLVTSDNREDRVAHLQFLVSYAYMKYGVKTCMGVATEPFGRGRSYDFVVTRSAPPSEVIDRLKTANDPFGGDDSL